MIWGQIEATILEKGEKTKNVKNQEGETWMSTNRENDLKNVGSSVQWIQPLQIIWSGILLPANIEKRRPDYPSTETTTTKEKKIPQTNYIKQQFPRHCTPGNRWQLSLKDGKQMRGAQTLPPDSYLERVSSLWHREKKLSENPMTFLSQGHRSWDWRS